MARLVLLNGAPGVGKSTIAALVAERLPDAVAVDVDQLKHALPEWQTDHAAAGRLARQQAVEVALEHLGLGRDVVIAQYVATSDFVEELAADAGDLGCGFQELVLVVPVPELKRRLGDREPVGTDAKPVGPADAARLIEAVNAFLLQRPRAELVDASGTTDQTVANVLAALAHGVAEQDE